MKWKPPSNQSDNNHPVNAFASTRPPAVVHLDLDGAAEIYKARGWAYPFEDDPIFETGLRRFLTLFGRRGIRCTLFVVAESLDDPNKFALLQEAVAQGHEIASHTLSHSNLRQLSKAEKRVELAGSRTKLVQDLGVPIYGFRAPGYQIDRECIDLLAETGYTYDTSIFPKKPFSRRFGLPTESFIEPACPFPKNPLIELPLPDYRPLPCPFNPSYSLILGMGYFSLGVRRHHAQGSPLVLLFHLIDLADPLPGQRLPGFMANFFTLSIMSEQRKLARCEQMLDFVQERYQLMTTCDLLSTWFPSTHEARGLRNDLSS